MGSNPTPAAGLAYAYAGGGGRARVGWRNVFADDQPLGGLTGVATTPDGNMIALSGPGDVRTGSVAGVWVGLHDYDWQWFSARGSTTAYTAGISTDGRYVGASGSTGAYRVDLTTMASIPVSVTATGTIVHGRGLLSGDAAWYAFPSAGKGITPSDSDRSTDIFIRGPLPLP